MRIKPSYIILAIVGFGFLYLALKLENDAYDRCMETLTHNECVKIFG